MQRLEVNCAVRLIYTSLGAKGLNHHFINTLRTLNMLQTLEDHFQGV